MKVKYKMHANVADVYKALLDSALAEVKIATDKVVTINDLKSGYKYKRKVVQNKRTIEVTIHIRRPIENKNIHISTSYPDAIYEMDYTFEKIDEKTTLLLFEQINNANKEAKTNIFFYFSMRKKLRNMERFIKTHKNDAKKEA